MYGSVPVPSRWDCLGDVLAESKFDYTKLEKPNNFVPGTFFVMFIDIVEFSQMGDNTSLRRAVRILQNSIVDVFSKCAWDVAGPVTVNDTLMIPTGDGYGIAFEPALCSHQDVLEYGAALSSELSEDGVPVRMGINQGPCFVHKDVNGRMNLCGWGIIDAGRAMSVGGKDHILCTAEFAHPYIDENSDENLKPIGKYTVKKRRLELYNYWSEDFGNKKRPPVGGKT